MATDRKRHRNTIHLIAYCLKSSIFGLISTFFAISNANGEEFTSNLHKFKLTYPPSLEIIDLKITNAPLALRTVGQPYPTVNVLVQPGPYKWGGTEHKSEQQRVIESYHGVGILDATLVESSVVYIKEIRQFRAKISYAYNDLRLTSLVAIISASDRHFIITCIDYESEMPAKVLEFTKILDSFELLDREGVLSIDDTMPNQARIVYLLLTALLLVAIWYLVYSRSNRRR